MKKRLSALTGNINILFSAGGDPLISGLAYDSRAVKPGFLFFALEGLHSDGHDYIENAVNKGAAAVIYSRDPENFLPGTAYIKTVNPRTSMAPVASAFYNSPADRLITTGVTGTDGKTTTVYLIDQLLELCGCSSGFISTAACKTGNLITGNPYRQSTPEAGEIQKMLHEMETGGRTHAVIEATSHGLSPRNNRLGGVSFNAAVFTNLSHEHLEFHGSIQQYREDKTMLFRMLKEDGFGVVNIDDDSAGYFIESTEKRVYTCSLTDPSADFYADKIKGNTRGSSFRISCRTGGRLRQVESSIALPGLFNVENVLEAFAVVLGLTGAPVEQIAAALPGLSAVRGRMKLLDIGQPFTVLIDYAHTPGSFAKLFPELRKMTGGKLIAVFGSAGERDIDKRPEQGRIAAGYSDIIILTDEDPRGEEPMAILEEIAAGIPEQSSTRGSSLFLIPDRRQAFTRAFSMAGRDDTVVLLGKGHESSIIYSGGAVDWDEETEALSALKGYV